MTSITHSSKCGLQGSGLDKHCTCGADNGVKVTETSSEVVLTNIQLSELPAALKLSMGIDTLSQLSSAIHGLDVEGIYSNRYGTVEMTSLTHQRFMISAKRRCF